MKLLVNTVGSSAVVSIVPETMAEAFKNGGILSEFPEFFDTDGEGALVIIVPSEKKTK